MGGERSTGTGGIYDVSDTKNLPGIPGRFFMLQYAVFLCFPEAVEVAVFVYGFHFVAFAQAEASFGSVGGLEHLALIALLGLQRDPLDVVLFLHGMGDRADLDVDLVTLDGVYGHVLFGGCVGGAGDELLHLLTAAHYGHAAVFDICDDVAAMGANIKLLFHSKILLILSVVFDKLVFSCCAEGTYKIIGQVCKCDTGLQIELDITLLFVIDPSAEITDILHI
jgi:hypothetical protein